MCFLKALCTNTALSATNALYILYNFSVPHKTFLQSVSFNTFPIIRVHPLSSTAHFQNFAQNNTPHVQNCCRICHSSPNKRPFQKWPNNHAFRRVILRCTICRNKNATHKKLVVHKSLVARKSKMGAKPCDLHGARCTCIWWTTRPLDHVNLNMLRVSISEIWAMLSYHRIQDGCQTVWPTWCLTHQCMGDHQTTWPCKFECAAGKCKRLMATVELPQNPRWPPNCTTYMAPNAPTCGGPPDHFTMQIWMHCGQA